MNSQKYEEIAKELYLAEENLVPIESLKIRYPNLTVEDAYKIQKVIEERKKINEVIKGRKIGLTSKKMQNMFNVNEPDYGYFTSEMISFNGKINISDFIQPKIEAELAFLLEEDLKRF